MINLGCLNILGINEACDLSQEKETDVKLELSPKYVENSESLEIIDKILRINNGNKKVIVDLSSALSSNIINVLYTEEND